MSVCATVPDPSIWPRKSLGTCRRDVDSKVIFLSVLEDMARGVGALMSRGVARWLLEPENPSLRCRTMVELLGRSPDDPEALESKRQIAESLSVKGLLGAMHPDGYWLQRHPGKDKMLGKGVEYGAFGTTHYCLSYLAELGMDRTDAQSC